MATAQLYPEVSLGRSASSAGPANDFFGRDTFAWNLGPLIRWSLPITAAARARDDCAQVADQAQRLYVGGRSAHLDTLDAQRSLASV